MRRRRNSVFPFIFLLFIFAAGPVSFLIPLFLMIALMVFVVSAIVSSANETNKKTSKVTNNKKRTSTVKKDNGYSLNNKELSKIDKVLFEYFQENISLPIVDNISLTTQKGTYTTLEELFITYRDEKICKFSEFEKAYPNNHRKVLDLLVELANHKNKVVKKEEKVEIKPEIKQEIKEEKPVFKNISEAEEYIDKINRLNNDIVSEEVTNGLYQTCDYLKKIDLAAQKDDESKLRKLYDYYLPILINILEEYKRLSKLDVSNDECKKCEVQLIKTIALINQALKSIYESLHEDDYMNLNADITTLQSLLKKDGFGETPFGGKDEG